MWLRAVGVLVAVLLTAGTGYVVSQAPTEVAQAPSAPPGSETETTTPTAPASSDPAPEPTATPAPEPSATTTQPSPVGRAEQRAATRLRRLVRRADVEGVVALSVLDVEGREVFAHHASRPVIPASTQKLAVAAAALVQLGPSHRYTTSVAATARPNARGVVNGDLVLVGGGDPTLAGPRFGRVEPERPRTPMEVLARRVRRAGVRRVTGGILADPTILAHEPVATGWRLRYFDSLDATRIVGLTVDAGRRVYRTSGGHLRSEAAGDPSRQAIVTLRRLLRARGVDVGRRLRVLSEPHPRAQELARIHSPPLETMLGYMVQRSDNHLADTIFRTVGAAAGSPTWVGSAGATANALAPLKLD
ncbi:MAG: hypothetical protein GEU74_09070, partial [Nitriliruptorales bacterium]|nr:hypothetical protein [Nitriliruptorales bacterium]